MKCTETTSDDLEDRKFIIKVKQFGKVVVNFSVQVATSVIKEGMSWFRQKEKKSVKIDKSNTMILIEDNQCDVQEYSEQIENKQKV